MLHTETWTWTLNMSHNDSNHFLFVLFPIEVFNGKILSATIQLKLLRTRKFRRWKLSTSLNTYKNTEVSTEQRDGPNCQCVCVWVCVCVLCSLRATSISISQSKSQDLIEENQISLLLWFEIAVCKLTKETECHLKITLIRIVMHLYLN